MGKRYVSIWFRHLTTDRMIRRRPELRHVPFVLAAPERGRMVVKAASQAATAKGIYPDRVVADCRAVLPSLEVFDAVAGLENKLLHGLAEWCIRYTPVVSIDVTDGLILDVSGCTHLWGGERAYLEFIYQKISSYGYDISMAMADTVGAAWAMSHYGGDFTIVETCMQVKALSALPIAALRIDEGIVERLDKLGLKRIGSLYNMPRTALRRRFGESILMRLDQALGKETEALQPVLPIEPYQERLPCLEPIRTAKGIEIAIRKLLERLCKRMAREGKGLRNCVLRSYRVDGHIQEVSIGTNKASRSVEHLCKLLELKIVCIEPDLGIELFLMEARDVEDIVAEQDALWHESKQNNAAVAELLDRLAGKVGVNSIHRYLPDEHYWPERSVKLARSFEEKATTVWRTDVPRPIHLLSRPEPIEVTVPIPDYPPMLFIHKDKLHNIRKADGPERIEQEWWLQKGVYRDYYCVEDDEGARYWLFRSGSYHQGDPKWFIHGFFA